MFNLWRTAEEEKPEIYPEKTQSLAEGVYNLWQSRYLGQNEDKTDHYACMDRTVEFFVLSSIGEGKTSVVRVINDENDAYKYTADYSSDSRIFNRKISQITPHDIINAYTLTDFTKKYSKLQDHFGLRRVGTLDEFVERIKAGKRP